MKNTQNKLIHYIKKKDIVIGVCQYALLFIDLKNNQTESIMELEEYPYQLESDDKRIYVGTRNEILMINQETYIIEKEIEKCSSFHLLIQLNENNSKQGNIGRFLCVHECLISMIKLGRSISFATKNIF